MPTETNNWPTKVASLALPTREAHVVASVWPSGAGTLLFLAELNLAPQIRQDLAAAITTTLEHILPSTQNASDVESALEQILLQLNPLLKSRERLLGNPLAPRYHLGLAFLRGQSIALSSIGHLNALIIGNGQMNNIFASAHNKSNIKPIFQNLIGGHLEPGETFAFATTSLLDYLPSEKFKQIISNHAPGQALREVEHYLTSLEHHPPVGIIALRLGEMAELEAGTQPSIEHFLKTKDATSSLLRPTVWSFFKKYLRRTKKISPYPAESNNETIFTKTTNVKNKPQESISYWQRINNLANKLAWLKNQESIVSTISWWLESKLALWRRLPLAKKILFILAIVALVTFSQSIVNMGKNNLKSKDSELYNKLVTQITESQAAIESALIYHDDIKAQNIFKDTSNLLAQLPNNTPSREQQYEALNNSLKLLQQRMERSIQLEGLSPWFNLLKDNSANAGQGLIWTSNVLYAYDSKNEISAITNDGKLKNTSKLPGELGKPTKAIMLDNTILFIGDSGKQALLDLKSRTASILEKPLPLTDGSFYDGKLYYLATKPKAIFRTIRTDKNFSESTRWLRSSQGELTNTLSLTVDGAIYTTDGKDIQKFVLGLKRDFKTQPLNPPLVNMTKIVTSNESDYLYLLAPNDKKVVIYDKQGKLVIQLYFSNLNELNDIAVDGQNKYLYLLDNKNIYRVSILNYIN
jgi:hypothetical protein